MIFNSAPLKTFIVFIILIFPLAITITTNQYQFSVYEFYRNESFGQQLLKREFGAVAKLKQMKTHLSLLSATNSSFTTIEDPRNCLYVMGNYCGPGWSLGKWWSGCYGFDTPISESNPLSGFSSNKVDECCKFHDFMCLESRAKNTSCSYADEQMIHCLQNTYCDEKDNYYCSIARLTMLNFFKYRGNTCC